MFTFGREHELKCAISNLKAPKNIALITAVINAIHDLLESQIDEKKAAEILSQAFVEGGAGVWEATGSWIRKLSVEYPTFESLWHEFAKNQDSKVRFKAACCLDDMPAPIAAQIREELKNDGNKKVREMASNK